MFKCLLSFETSHYVVYLNSNESTGHLTFDQFKQCLANHYDNLIRQLNLELDRDRFEIFDSDFQQFVLVDRYTRISNLSKLKVIKCWPGVQENEKKIVKQQNENQSVDCVRTSTANHSAINEFHSIEQNNGLYSAKSQIITNSVLQSKNNSLNDDKFNGKLFHESTRISSSDLNKHFSNEIRNARTEQVNKRSSTDSNKGLSESTKLLSEPNRSTDSFNKRSSTDLIKVLSANLNRCLPTDFNRPGDQQNLISALNTSLKTFQSIQCQTDETERRVIRMKDNPFKRSCDRLQSDYNRLIEDNKRLNAKLELYKQGSVANATNYLDDFMHNSDEIERLKKELQEAKEEQKTIMEAFKKKSKEFRRVVYLLTGFKFDALEQRKYRISHIYSNPNDYLFFTFEKEEVINLLGNEFSEKFYELIKIYLVEQGSYPSFLASITMRLFKEKQENSKQDLKVESRDLS